MRSNVEEPDGCPFLFTNDMNDKPIDPGARATRFRFKGGKHPAMTKHPRLDKDQNTADGQKRNEAQAQAQAPPHNDNTSHLVDDPNINVAFRESLFDALADPEGAAYWERVYGQPIHIYKRPTRFCPISGTSNPIPDDEYVEYVRANMFQRTREGQMDEDLRRRTRERERARKERRARETREARQQHFAAQEEARFHKKQRDCWLEMEMDEALRRGNSRSMFRIPENSFTRYLKAWEEWDGTKERIPWPTESSNRSGKDMEEKAVRFFFTNGLGNAAGSAQEFAAKLKEQRVRWHPDKMQQKLGGKDKVSKSVMADITLVFQVIDSLYNDFRNKTSK